MKAAKSPQSHTVSSGRDGTDDRPGAGLFIGVICGLAVLLLIRTATASRATVKATVAEISQLLALPTFSFGGPWATSALGPTAWVWFGAGILAGLILGELAVRLGSGQHSKASTPTHHPPP